MRFKKCKEELKKVLKSYAYKRQALISCLHVTEEKCGYIPEEIISFLAKELDLPRVEVYSIVTFYSMFTLEKQAKYMIRICASLPCYLKGSDKILKVLEQELGIKENQTTPDGKFGIEAVSCLGHCDNAPVAMINDKIHENLTPQKLKKIIQDLKNSSEKLKEEIKI